MIAGTPGSLKTVFALNLADKTKVPTLYFSNDTDEKTVALRLLATRVQRSTTDLEDKIERSPEWASDTLSDMDHIRWSFHSSPSLPYIEEEMASFEELYGEPPHLVVVDVLMGVDYAEDSEHASLARIMAYLKFLARDSGACFLVVHHTSEKVRPSSGNICQPRWAILQMVNQFPILILTVAFQNGRFYLSPVKNRNGPGKDDGSMALEMPVNAATATISEYR